ncbi:DUF1624 domain-containing protein [Fibrella sp. HMF5335]|uniref:DUF1624 domain-containing protein n=1 Tax=Fibrella rubiginis TaxID=2817060 RepID=A0A939K0G0_9BACT|nr:heparan-alpha-glucosaminide N-acetyltransferase domain-containing protein [Fibrella rubiginis]MBO0936052.1 DUF1624 domain-containing protein [Fibrella rubiginis]
MRDGHAASTTYGFPHQQADRDTQSVAAPRIESVDLLRGVVMILMALDHVRSYFHYDSFMFSPTDLAQTTPALFATRLITHLCAPTFIFLAGTSACFMARRKTRREVSSFLLTRGLWLIVLQLTVIRFAWNFDPGFHFNSSNIISTIGCCLILLALLIHLPVRGILGIGLGMVIGHNTLDSVSFENGSALDVVWSFMHGHKLYPLGPEYSFLFLYPIIPWVGVMALGYCLGSLYAPGYSAAKRKQLLRQTGIASLFVFLLVRWVNRYGDPVPWTSHRAISMTIMSFFNLEKYPPSFLFLCLTLGVALLLLSAFDAPGKRDRWRPIATIGNVALFYYVLHIYLIHLVALLTVMLSGYPWQTMVFTGPVSQVSPLLKGHYGFGLGEVYGLWIAFVGLLYLPCAYWYAFKRRKRASWWVSYV